MCRVMSINHIYFTVTRKVQTGPLNSGYHKTVKQQKEKCKNLKYKKYKKIKKTKNTKITSNTTRPKPNNYSQIKSYKHKIKSHSNSVNRKQCAMHKVHIYVYTINKKAVDNK